MTIRFSRRAIGCALLASTALTAGAFISSPASALVPAISLTPRPAPDSNGVDVITGRENVSLRSVAIGQAGEGGLTYTNGYSDGSGQDTFTLELSGASGATSHILNIQGRAISFTKDASGVFQPADADGSTLVQTGGDYTYTARDGTVIQFASAYADPGGLGITARGTTITRPNGEILSYWYRVQPSLCPSGQICPPSEQGAVRVQSVTNNFGYQLKAYYAADLYNSETAGDWTLLTKVVAINNAVDFCTGTADSCGTFTQAWPELDLGESSNGSTVTDTLADNLSNTVTVASSTGSMAITLPASPSVDVSYTFDSSNRVATITRGGGTWTYSYSDSGTQRTTTVAQPLGGNRVYVSDTSLQRVLSITDELGRTTTMQYDSNGRLTRTTKPEGNYVQLTYDSRGNVTQTRHVAKSGSGLADIVTSAAFPATCANPVTCNEPTSTTDAKGNVTNYTYDPTHGGVLTATQPAPATGGISPQVRYTYATKQAYSKNSTGSIVASGAPIYLLTAVSTCQTLASCTGSADEVKTTIDYGPQVAGTANNLLPVSTSKGSGDGVLTATTTNGYDVFGNVTSVDGPLAGTADTSGFRYDAVRRLTMRVSPDPDGTGPLLNRAQQITYDADGNVTRIEAGTTTSLTGAFTAVTSGERVEFTYDSLGRKVTQSLVSGTITSPVINTVTQYSYDAAGRLNCTAVRMNSGAFASLPSDACTLGTQGGFGPDRISQVIYDNASEVTQNKVAVGTTDAATERTLTYNNNGTLASLTDGENNKTTYIYDGFDRLSQTQYPSATKGAGTSNASDYEQLTYDSNSNVTARRLRDATSVTSTFDNLNRVTLKTLPNSEPAVSYSYDNLGRLITASQTGNTLTFGYDALSRQTSDGQAWGTISRSFDAAGRVTKVTWQDGFYVNYDRLVTGELSKVRENGATSGVGILATYGYDNLGNRTSLTYGNGVVQSSTFDAASRLATLTNDLSGTTNDQTVTFAYNPASQITSASRSNDAYAFGGSYNVNRSYTSNGLNRYTAAGPASFTYDGRGNLISDGTNSYTYSSENRLKTASGGVSLYYDPLGRISEYDTSVSTRFMNDGPEIAVEVDNPAGNVLRRYVRGDSPDELIVWYEGSGTTNRRFLSTDERGSIVAATDSSGNLVGINSYDEYGIPASTNIGRFQYTGQAWLPEIGLQYSKARIYSPTLGRFLQTDPAGYGDSPNLYAYGIADPVNHADPSGLVVCTGSHINTPDCSNSPDPSSCTGDCSSFVPANEQQQNYLAALAALSTDLNNQFSLTASEADCANGGNCFSLVDENGVNRAVQPLPSDLAAYLREPVFGQELGNEIVESNMYGNGSKSEFGFWAAHDIFSGDFIAGYTQSTDYPNQQNISIPPLFPWQYILFYFHVHPWGFSDGRSGLSTIDIATANQLGITMVSFSPNGFDWIRH